uniref:Putative secreted protein ovary overexpressed n=1 Tax=Rhipicephalus microplus TaxID=6941 RepID=A0A6M2D9I3_RHIMP
MRGAHEFLKVLILISRLAAWCLQAWNWAVWQKVCKSYDIRAASLATYQAGMRGSASCSCLHIAVSCVLDECCTLYGITWHVMCVLQYKQQGSSRRVACALQKADDCDKLTLQTS